MGHLYHGYVSHNQRVSNSVFIHDYYGTISMMDYDVETGGLLWENQ